MKNPGLKGTFRKASLLVFYCVLIGHLPLWAQQPAADTAKTKMAAIMLMPSGLTWAEAPPGLPAGAGIAVLSGDPFKPGLFSLRLRLPANYIIPAHSHLTDEHVVVISGTLALGTGDKLDNKNLKLLTAGAYALFPHQMNHYAMAKTETVIQLYGIGPFAITYVNPADDPRNKKQ